MMGLLRSSMKLLLNGKFGISNIQNEQSPKMQYRCAFDLDKVDEIIPRACVFSGSSPTALPPSSHQH